MVGRLLGLHDVADVTGDDAMGNAAMEDRSTEPVIAFGCGDEIVISGASTYPTNGKLIKADESWAHVLEYRLD